MVREVGMNCPLNHPYECRHPDHEAVARLSANVSHANGQLTVVYLSCYYNGTRLEACATWRVLPKSRLGSGEDAFPGNYCSSRGCCGVPGRVRASNDALTTPIAGILTTSHHEQRTQTWLFLAALVGDLGVAARQLAWPQQYDV